MEGIPQTNLWIHDIIPVKTQHNFYFSTVEPPGWF